MTAETLDYARSVPILIGLIANRLTASSTRVFDERHGLGTTEWRLLATVAAYPGLPGKAIAAIMGMDPAAISRAARSCAARGLLTIGAGERQRNYQRLELTATGRSIHAAGLATAAERETALLAPLDDAERAQLVELLGRVLAQTAMVPGADADPVTTAAAPRAPATRPARQA